MEREQININKIVNFDEDTKEITVLDYLFKHSDGFKGATGTKFEPVSKEEYKEFTILGAIEKYLEDAVSEEDAPIKYREHERGMYKHPFKRWAQDIKDHGEEGTIYFDDSYYELWDYLREELGMDEDEAFVFTCIGGGRCFSKDYVGNRSSVLSKLIREYES